MSAPNTKQVYVDQNGRLTPEGYRLLADMHRETATGWVAPTGTASRATFDTATVTTAQLAERVKALVDDLTAQRLLGA